MSILPTSNATPLKQDEPAPGTKPERPARPKKKTKNLNQIHSKPLPLSIHPLPAFHPSNPISLLQLAYTWISHILYPPVSHPAEPYIGYFSLETRSVHVTNPEHVRALWEMGFFGKGTLSRSEPNWLEREKARLRRERFGAEDATMARREERRLFKLERARVEAEKIERQRLAEKGGVEGDGGGEEGAEEVLTESVDDEPNDDANADPANLATNLAATILNADVEGNDNRSEPAQPTHIRTDSPQEDSEPDPSIENQEHLQLTLTESFFLSYALGVLAIYPAPHDPSSNTSTPPLSPKSTPKSFTTTQLLHLFTQHNTIPPSPFHSELAPDDPFILSYTTYHHFRSLGWVVRPGIKFGVDFLLYNRGPAFSHAEFGVLVVPAYTDRFWGTPGGRLRRRNSVVERAEMGDGVGSGGKDWWWLHAVNRVQSQVKKTLVLCYVDVPSPFDVERYLPTGDEGRVDIGGLLRAYKVREFVLRRWVPNRTRD